MKDYDYGGVLPTHPDCNNRFGPETYVARALEFLAALAEPDCMLERQHRDNPSIKILALNSAFLPNFEEGDLRFFKMLDVRNVDEDTWSAPEFFEGKERTNPVMKALFVTFSVLAKSAAAVLYKRHRISIPDCWRIHAFAYTGADPASLLGDIFGPMKPFDDGLLLYVHKLEDGNFLVVYKARGTLMYFLFALVESPRTAAVLGQFPEPDQFYFEGANLNALQTTGWKKS
jgi:hypothetical protein